MLGLWWANNRIWRKKCQRTVSKRVQQGSGRARPGCGLAGNQTPGYFQISQETCLILPIRWLHPDDELLWKALPQQCRAFGVPYTPQPDPDHWLEHEQPLECGGSCIHTPGHTPGSSSFYFAEGNLLIAGDTLFLGSIGRTDFPGGDPRAIKSSIQKRLYTLDEAATVVTGHGPETSIGHEMRHNAFVRA